MNEPKDKELNIEMSDQVREQMASDPKIADFMRDFMAAMHQAHDAVKRGQYKTLDEAVEAITGNRPEKIDPETLEVIEGASLHDDMELGDNDDGTV